MPTPSLEWSDLIVLGAESMPAEIEVNASGGGVDFKIEDEKGERVHFKLDRRMASALVVMGLQELACLPPAEGELLQDSERPLLEGRPSFQVAIDHQSGDALVGFDFTLYRPCIFCLTMSLRQSLCVNCQRFWKPRDRRGFNELKANSKQVTLRENSHDRRVR